MGPNLPGFAAESSLYASRVGYRTAARATATTGSPALRPAIHCDGAQRLSCHIQCNLKGLQCDVETCHCIVP
jgi:hypothetical protein